MDLDGWCLLYMRSVEFFLDHRQSDTLSNWNRMFCSKCTGMLMDESSELELVGGKMNINVELFLPFRKTGYVSRKSLSQRCIGS